MIDEDKIKTKEEFYDGLMELTKDLMIGKSNIKYIEKFEMNLDREKLRKELLENNDEFFNLVTGGFEMAIEEYLDNIIDMRTRAVELNLLNAIGNRLMKLEEWKKENS